MFARVRWAVFALCVLALTSGCGREQASGDATEASVATTATAPSVLGNIESSTATFGDESCTAGMTFLTSYMDANLFMSSDLVMAPDLDVSLNDAGDPIGPNAVAVSGYVFSQDWSKSALRPEGNLHITTLPSGGRSMIGRPALPRGNAPLEVIVYLDGPEQLAKVTPESFVLLKYGSCDTALPIHPEVKRLNS